MTGTLIDEVAQYLATQGVGTYADTGGNIFIGNLPTDPTPAIGIFETTGLAPDIYTPIHLPSFQILIRDVAINTGQALAQTIRTLLHDQYNFYFTLGGTYIYACNLQGEGGHIGRDDNGRDLFSLNFQCRVR